MHLLSYAYENCRFPSEPVLKGNSTGKYIKEKYACWVSLPKFKRKGANCVNLAHLISLHYFSLWCNTEWAEIYISIANQMWLLQSLALFPFPLQECPPPQKKVWVSLAFSLPFWMKNFQYSISEHEKPEYASVCSAVATYPDLLISLEITARKTFCRREGKKTELLSLKSPHQHFLRDQRKLCPFQTGRSVLFF